jgi:hypothetical protein
MSEKAEIPMGTLGMFLAFIIVEILLFFDLFNNRIEYLLFSAYIQIHGPEAIKNGTRRDRLKTGLDHGPAITPRSRPRSCHIMDTGSQLRLWIRAGYVPG